MWFSKKVEKEQPLLDTSQTPEWSMLFKQLAKEAKDERLKRYYSTPMVNGETPIEQVPFVSVDFETTGLNSEEDVILTIGLVPFTIDRVQCNGSAHWVVNPNRELNHESVIIHGITDSEVKNAPQLSQILG
ncbi:exonuclease domain-containing protein, partial [Vibrio parahaemolyticus]|nr:exonuclease domain-containing protein [Vibrio parahaemolyticus]